MIKNISFILCFWLLGFSAFAAEVSQQAGEAAVKQAVENGSENAVEQAEDVVENAADAEAELEEETEAESEEDAEDLEDEMEEAEEAAKQMAKEQSDAVSAKSVNESSELLAYDISKYTTLGVGLGLVAVGITYGIFAKNDMDDYNDKYKQYSIIDKQLYDDAKKKALISTSTYIAGGVVLGASVTLFILDALNVGESPLRKFGFAPILGPKTQGASVSVRF